MKIKEMISQKELEKRIDELAKTLNADYQGKQVTLVCILKGSVIFTVDLSKKLEFDIEYDFMDISSYSGTESTGVIKINMDLEEAITGKHVLLIEDIIDTGRTLSHVRKHLLSQKPASFKICTLLDKPERRIVDDTVPEYVGFTIPDEFVVGYGLDYNQKYRNLPYVGVVSFDDEQ